MIFSVRVSEFCVSVGDMLVQFSDSHLPAERFGLRFCCEPVSAYQQVLQVPRSLSCLPAPSHIFCTVPSPDSAPVNHARGLTSLKVHQPVSPVLHQITEEVHGPSCSCFLRDLTPVLSTWLWELDSVLVWCIYIFYSFLGSGLDLDIFDDPCLSPDPDCGSICLVVTP